MGCSGSAPAPDPEAAPSAGFSGGLVWERARRFDEVYELLDGLGAGAFATVSRARRRPSGNRSLQRSDSGSELKGEVAAAARHLFAAKIMEIKRGDAGLRGEIDVLRRLDHPHVASPRGRSERPDAFCRSCTCLLYTSPSPRDATLSRMPSSA